MASDPELVEPVRQARGRGAGFAINWTRPPPKAAEKPAIESITLFDVPGVAPWPMPRDKAEQVLRNLLGRKK